MGHIAFVGDLDRSDLTGHDVVKNLGIDAHLAHSAVPIHRIQAEQGLSTDIAEEVLAEM